MRGYNFGTFFSDEGECGSGNFATGVCPAFDRLLGTRLATTSFELRIPVFGVPEYGLLNVPFLPLTVSPFVDAGVAWTADERPKWSFSTTGAERTPVVSAGVSARFNVLGYAILEVYGAYPFQRPGRGWVYGVQLAPGW